VIPCVFFCECPLSAGQPDQAFEREYRAAESAGLRTILVDHDALVSGDMSKALRRVERTREDTRAIYRGWMVRVDVYTRVYRSLADLGYELLTAPDVFRRCHHLPGWYASLQDVTPRSVWIGHGPPFTDQELQDATRQVGAEAAIVKDFVKSEKYAWHDACYIHDASDLSKVRRIVDGFLERRGDAFEGGLVLREFQRLASRTDHPNTGMPVANEWRVFWLEHKPVLVVRGFESGESSIRPPIDLACNWARRVDSQFFTMDLALDADGNWIVIELGDGQVAGLPDETDIEAFYSSISMALRQ
jgi:hypothetical protein